MFVAYRNKFSLTEGDVRFVVDGQRVKPFHTPEYVSVSCAELLLAPGCKFSEPHVLLQHHMNDGDEVEAILEMLGGH